MVNLMILSAQKATVRGVVLFSYQCSKRGRRFDSLENALLFSWLAVQKTTRSGIESNQSPRRLSQSMSIEERAPVR